MRYYLLALVLVAVLGQVPLTAPAEDAMVRLAWRHLGQRAEVRLTSEELEQLPFHMRPQEGVTQTRFVPYRLKVRLNGEPALDREVAPGGVHGDRPLAVFESLPVEPGTVRVELEFFSEGESHRLEQVFILERGQVLLVGFVDGEFTTR